MDTNIAARFWSKVDIRGDNECWGWNSVLDRHGYGEFSVGHTKYIASRMAWIVSNGDIPRGLCVLHSCDNPACVNPKHLHLGTKQDNSTEMSIRGRSTTGERSSFARLTWDKVKEIRRKFHNEKMGCVKLYKEYGVCRRTIENIVYNKTWKEI